MCEIEIKAHVKKECLKDVRDALKSFCSFVALQHKKDEYFRLCDKAPADPDCSPVDIALARTTAPITSPAPSIRLRSVDCWKTLKQKQQGKPPTTECFVTYKKKQTKQMQGCYTGTEINTELEAKIEKPEPLRQYLLDSGHTLYLTKEKTGEFWACDTDCGKAHLELLEVGSLGWFIEIEIVQQQNTNEKKAKEVLFSLLKKCGIQETAIETKYYSQMLL